MSNDGRWTVEQLAGRFGEVGQEPMPILERLKAMEDNGLIGRQLYSERPPRVEYLLTDKGRSLGPIVKAMREWGTKNL